MTRLDNSQFLKQVETLTQSNNGKSSIYLTQKRLSSSITTTEEGINDLPTNVITPHPKTTTTNTTTNTINNDSKYPLLIRLSMNSSDNKSKTKTINKEKERVKISTVVEINQLNEFWDQYIQILKTGFMGLKKKKDKKKSHTSGNSSGATNKIKKK